MFFHSLKRVIIIFRKNNKSRQSSENRYSLSDNSTSKSDWTVWILESMSGGFAAIAIGGASVGSTVALTGGFGSFEGVLESITSDNGSLTGLRNRTPVLGDFLASGTRSIITLVFSGLRSFTLNLNGGLYTTCSLTLSLSFEMLPTLCDLLLSALGRIVGRLWGLLFVLSVKPTGVDLDFGNAYWDFKSQFWT